MTDLDLHVPTPEESQGAEQALRALGEAASVLVRASSRPDASSVELPDEARTLLMRILAHLANGDAVTVLPVQAELTAQQAAELLGVSRPFLISLIDEGKLPCRRVGTHRRIPLADLLVFKAANKAERRAIAAELTEEAAELGLGYR